MQLVLILEVKLMKTARVLAFLTVATAGGYRLNECAKHPKASEYTKRLSLFVRRTAEEFVRDGQMNPYATYPMDFPARTPQNHNNSSQRIG